ncbi:MAG: thermostable hemolysin [Pseudomonadales bacterium]|nr:thermostable hemolysin [Pseudomonadales bacterium]
MGAIGNFITNQELTISKDGEVTHGNVNKLISKAYAKHFQCDLRHFLPSSFSLVSSNEVVACTGFQSADHSELFLEQYLDKPIEQALSIAMDSSIERKDIVEIGGFAVTSSNHALSFMLQLAPAFQNLGFRYAVCTVTYPVRKYLKNLGLDTVFLGDATPDMVDTSDNAWGSYYRLKPVILGGNINAAVQKIYNWGDV